MDILEAENGSFEGDAATYEQVGSGHRMAQTAGIRGWTGQRADFPYPIMAVAGENGSGKSTLLQAAAAVYRQPPGQKPMFASQFYPDTPVDQITDASLRFSVREGPNTISKTVSKRTKRWRGNPQRPERRVVWLDLSSIQPLAARPGYPKLLKANVKEGVHTPFDEHRLRRYANIMRRPYAAAGLSVSTRDEEKNFPVYTVEGRRISGWHHGAGEIAAAELLAPDYPQNSLVLIDEVETSLHPRAQRALMRDLAAVARSNELQIIVSTHSTFILEELPQECRIYIMNEPSGRRIVTGVSPEFAMTKMDDENHPECDVYVEDPRSEALLAEIIIH